MSSKALAGPDEEGVPVHSQSPQRNLKSRSRVLTRRLSILTAIVILLLLLSCTPSVNTRIITRIMCWSRRYEAAISERDLPSREVQINRLQQSTGVASTHDNNEPVPTHIISVGKAAHIFTPDSIVAEAGAIVRFEFFPKNHSVVQASFDYPCIPIGMVDPAFNSSGFWSGFYPVDKVLETPPYFEITVNNTDPMFFYCSALGSCIDWGMVGAINPARDKPLAAHRENSRKASYSLSPGDEWPSEDSIPGETTPVIPVVPTKTGGTSTAPGNYLSAGGIVGIVLGGMAIMALAMAAIALIIGRNRKREGGPQHWKSSDWLGRGANRSSNAGPETTSASIYGENGPFTSPIRPGFSSLASNQFEQQVSESVITRDRLTFPSMCLSGRPLEMRGSQDTLAKVRGRAKEGSKGTPAGSSKEGIKIAPPEPVEIYSPSKQEREDHWNCTFEAAAKGLGVDISEGQGSKEGSHI